MRLLRDFIQGSDDLVEFNPIFGVLIALLGTMIGSFLGMLSYRIPNEVSLFKPARSFCPSCSMPIAWYDNIPLVSFFLLHKKCRKCGASIPFFYPIIEFMSAIVFLLLYLFFGFGEQFIVFATLCSLLLLLSMIDCIHKAVPDYLLLLVVIIACFVPNFDLKSGLLFAGGFVMLDFFVTFYIQNIKARITKNEQFITQKALGDGDIPIVFIIGGVLGLGGGLLAVVLASLVAIIPALISTIYKNEIETPFIPYLSFGFFISLLWDDVIRSILGVL